MAVLPQRMPISQCVQYYAQRSPLLTFDLITVRVGLDLV